MNVSETREKAKVQKCRADLTQIRTQIELKRNQTDKLLSQITGSACSACACWDATPPNNISGENCFNKMTTTFQRIGFPALLKDPWGDPYLIDENEGELYNGTTCRRDSIRTYN